jgi:hypothetical protein
VSGSGLGPAPALVDRMMVFNLLACGNWILAKGANHTAIPA